MTVATIIIACFVAAALIFGATCRLDRLVFVWGVLLPIYSVGPIPPLVFDLARYGLAALIGVRALSARPRRAWPERRALAVWVGLLSLLGSWLTVNGATRPDAIDFRLGGTMLLSTFAAAAVLARLEGDLNALFKGFAVGALVSGLVLIDTALGLFGGSQLSPVENAGFNRLAGLGSSAPRAAADLALGSIVWLALAVTQKRHRYWVAACSTMAAMLLSGGRVGLAMLVLAGAWMLLRRRIGIRHSVFFLALGAAGTVWLTRHGLEVGTWTRSIGEGSGTTSDFTSGRLALNQNAVTSIVHYPLGEGSTSFIGQHGATPHFAPLTFGVAGGLFAVLLTSVLMIRLVALTLRPGTQILAVGISGALVAYALVEPTGSFVGLSAVSILLACISISSISVNGPSRPLATRPESFSRATWC